MKFPSIFKDPDFDTGDIGNMSLGEYLDLMEKIDNRKDKIKKIFG